MSLQLYIGNQPIGIFELPAGVQMSIGSQSTQYDYINLKSTDDNYYRITLVNDGGLITTDISQAVEPEPINNGFTTLTLLNTTDDLYYDVTLVNDGSLITFDISQTPSGSSGLPYIYLLADDSEYYKITLVTDVDLIVMDIDQTPL